MTTRFEELDWKPTPIGDISLRRRRDPLSGDDVYEVKLGDEFLMSSLFTEGEIALARLGLAPLAHRTDLDVAVGGLGLGYTAHAALQEPAVRSLIVVDTLGEVIDWHRRGLVPARCPSGRHEGAHRARRGPAGVHRVVGRPAARLPPTRHARPRAGGRRRRHGPVEGSG